jgi:hypothetical protein
MTQEENGWYNKLERATVEEQDLMVVLNDFTAVEWEDFIRTLVEESMKFSNLAFSFGSPIIYFTTIFESLSSSSLLLISNTIELLFVAILEEKCLDSITIKKAKNAFFIAYATPINVNVNLLESIAFKQSIGFELRTKAARIIASQHNTFKLNWWQELVKTDDETTLAPMAIDALTKQSTKLAIKFLSELKVPPINKVNNFRIVTRRLLQKILTLPNEERNKISLSSFPYWCRDYIIELVKQSKFRQLDDDWVRSNPPDYVEHLMSKSCPANTTIPPRSDAINIENDEIENNISRSLSDSTVYRSFITGLNQEGINGSGIGLTSRAISVYRRYSQGINKDEFGAVIFIDSRIEKMSQIFRVIGDKLDDELIKSSCDDAGVVIDSFRKRHERNNKKILLIIDDFDKKLPEEGRKLRHFLVEVEHSCKALLTVRNDNVILNKSLISNSAKIHLPPLNIDTVKRMPKSSQKKNIDFIVQCYLGNPLAVSLAVATDKELTTCPLPPSPQVDRDPVWYAFQESIQSLDELSRELLILLSIFCKSKIFHNPFLSQESLEHVLSVKFNKNQVDESIQVLKKRNLILSDNEFKDLPIVGISDSISDCVLRFNKLQNSDINVYEDNIFSKLTEHYIYFTEKYGGTDWNNRANFEKIEMEWYNILAVLEWNKKWNEKENRFNQIKKIWFKVNRFADLYGYSGDRKKWLDTLIKYYKSTSDSNTYASCLSSKGWTLTMSGVNFHEKAQEVLEEAWKIKNVELVTKANLAHNMTVLYCRRGQDFCEKDNYRRGQEFYDKAKAKILDQQRLYEDIEPEFRKGNIDNFNESDLKRLRINCARDNAKIKFSEKNWTDAYSEYSVCLDMCIKVDWTRMTSYCHYMLAETLLNQVDNKIDPYLKEEKLKEVLEHISKGVVIAKGNCNKRRLGYFKRSYSKLQYQQGNQENCEYWTREAENDFNMLISDLGLC